MASEGIKTTGKDVEKSASLESKLARIRQHRTSKLPHQKQLATILDAIEQTLKEEETELTPSAYVVALLSLLGQDLTDIELTKEDVASSSIYLLDSIIPHVSQPLLREKSGPLLSYLNPLLEQPDVTSGLLRSTIGCLETILTAQAAAAWSQHTSDTDFRLELRKLLEFCVDDRPKVRKRAQEAVTAILDNPPDKLTSHPALNMCSDLTMSAVTTQFKLFSEKHNKRIKTDGKDTTEKKVIFSLQLIRSIAMCESGWPHNKVEALCNNLFTVSRSQAEHLVVSALDVFQAMFTTSDDRTHAVDSIDSANFLSIVQSILNLCPSETDQQLAPPWIAIVIQSFSAYTQIDSETAFAKLPEIFEILVSFLQSGLLSNISASASQGLVALASTCIPVELLLEKPMKAATEKSLTKISSLAASLLSVKYQAVWKDIMQFFVALFDAFGTFSDPYLLESLKTISKLRNVEQFEGIAEVDQVIAAAIRSLGPEKILNLLPLNLDNHGPTSPGRAYLLPLLRDNTMNATLAHFMNEMVPLGETLLKKAQDATDNGKGLDAKICETLFKQIWSLFPRYCDLPTDLRLSLSQKNAERIANVLYESIELRAPVCKGLRILVESHQIYLDRESENFDPVLESKISREDAAINLNFLGSIASKFLVVFFNIFNQTAADSRLYLLETISAFLSITPKEDITVTFEKVSAMVKSSLPLSGEGLVSQTMMDLVIAMIPYLPKLLYNDVKQIVFASLTSSDYQIQRRSYRAVSKMALSENGDEYILANIGEFEKALLGAALAVKPPARNTRLTALIDIVQLLPSSALHLITAIVPEAVIGVKELNEKTREAAYQLLIAMGDKMAGGGTVSMQLVADVEDTVPMVEASIEEYFTMVSAGMAGTTPHMISATISALSHLLFQYRNIIRKNVMEELVETVNLFLTSHNREIVKASLGFVKVTVTCLPAEIVQPRLAAIVPNIVEWAHEHHARFKLKVKHLIERLIRRFGAQEIEKVFPESDKKLFTNIRKIKERSRRKKLNVEKDIADTEEGHRSHRKQPHMSEYEAALYDSSSEDDDAGSDEDTKSAVRGRRMKKSAHEAYIVNDEDNEPLDLLNNVALAKVTSSKPTLRGKPKSRQNKMTKDNEGKFIVSEENTKPAKDTDEDMINKLAAKAAQASSVNAYVDAVKNGPVRGQRNRLKYKNKREHDDGSDEEMKRAKPARRRARF
ncbi:NUC173 domain-containing protein [Lipomyces arxii]|uniref:NUC173 domain-containing protein n=1 Tax=Lipomyces arxii TaxID=56418 RepID=UPI0034CEB1CD